MICYSLRPCAVYPCINTHKAALAVIIKYTQYRTSENIQKVKIKAVIKAEQTEHTNNE